MYKLLTICITFYIILKKGIKMNTLDLTINLIAKKYDKVELLLRDIAKDEEHAIFVFSRDFAREILERDAKFYWLTNKVNDLNSIVVNNIQNFIKKYYINVLFVTKNNKLTIFLQTNNVKDATKWLMERYVNILKNLFDKRSSLGLDNISYIYFNSLKNGEELISSSLI